MPFETEVRKPSEYRVDQRYFDDGIARQLKSRGERPGSWIARGSTSNRVPAPPCHPRPRRASVKPAIEGIARHRSVGFAVAGITNQLRIPDPIPAAGNRRAEDRDHRPNLAAVICLVQVSDT